MRWGGFFVGGAQAQLREVDVIRMCLVFDDPSVRIRRGRLNPLRDATNLDRSCCSRIPDQITRRVGAR